MVKLSKKKAFETLDSYIRDADPDLKANQSFLSELRAHPAFAKMRDRGVDQHKLEAICFRAAQEAQHREWYAKEKLIRDANKLLIRAANSLEKLLPTRTVYPEKNQVGVTRITLEEFIDIFQPMQIADTVKQIRTQVASLSDIHPKVSRPGHRPQEGPEAFFQWAMAAQSWRDTGKVQDELACDLFQLLFGYKKSLETYRRSRNASTKKRGLPSMSSSVHGK
jgi:hypothetical protein